VPPETIGPYRIGETIAAGGMGIVYCGQHVETGETVALKTVAGLRPGMLGSIRREILALERVTHPGVVRLVGEGMHEGVPWHATELLQGRPLRAHIEHTWTTLRKVDPHLTTQLANGWPTTPETPDSTRRLSKTPPPIMPGLRGRPPAGGGVALAASLSIVRKLCQTLAFLHGEGIVHRDLKPDNVILLDDDRAVLVDFGIMRRFAGAAGREALEVEHDAAGTLIYMAPEQILGADIDARADLYALGCILYEMLCGRPPFFDDRLGSISKQQLTSPPEPPATLVEGVDPQLEALVLRLLAKDPRDRPGYADDVGEELAALGAEACAEYGEPPPRAYLYRPNFSGRTTLIETLDGELDGALDGRGHSLVLRGPSGSGKTRVCVELARRAIARGMRVVSGECTPIGVSDRGNGLPAAPFRPLLLAIADRCRHDGPEVTSRILGAQQHVLAELEPALGTLPSQHAHSVPPRLPEGRARERLQRAFVEVLERFSEREPLLIVLDDLQWADDLTVGILRALINRPAGALHAMILITCRSEGMDTAFEELRSAENVLSLRLDPLAPSEVASIISGMTARDDPPPVLVHKLVAESGGNPFFVAEYLKAAVTEGILRRERGRWQFHLGELSALLAPGSVQALVTRRLEGLAPLARTLVLSGSVLGRAFSHDQLRELTMLPNGRPLEEALEQLVGRQILLEEESGIFRFAHDKIRESAYQAIPEAERRRMHLRAAEGIPHDSSDPLHFRQLAHHYHAAGDDARAFAWSERAGQTAHAVGAYREAREHLSRALSIAERLPPHTPLERARLHRMYAEALDGTGEIDASGRHFMEALAALGRPLPHSKAGFVRLLLRQVMVQGAHRALPTSLVRARNQRRTELEEAAISAGRLMAYFFFRNRILELLASVTLANNLAERADAAEPHARAASFLAGMVGMMGLSRAARTYFELAEQAAHKPGELTADLFCAQVKGSYHVHRAEWDEARACLEPALERSVAAGAAFETEAILMSSALVSSFTGDVADAEKKATRLRDSALSLGHRMHETWGRIILAECALKRVRPDDVFPLIEPLLAELERDGDVVNRLNCLGLIAGAQLARGQLDRALDTVAAAHRQIEEVPQAELATYHLHVFAPEVLLAAWQRARQRGAATRSHERAMARACDAARRYARVAHMAGPFALRHQASFEKMKGRIPRARKLYAQSAALAHELGMPDEEHAARRAQEELGG
jgi:serine/threonine protein kinase/tetratricopeptide (TPR) repeat protein